MAAKEKVEQKEQEVSQEKEVEVTENCCKDKESCKCDENKKELEEKIALQEKMIQDLQEKNARVVEKVKLAQAELINYRCRKDKEVQDTLKYCNTDIVKDLLPVVDNFERAIKLDDNNLTDELSKFLEGFKMIYAGLTDVLTKHGVTEINRLGEIFDPSLEQALLTDSDKEKQEDEVLDVLLKGYKLKDRVIRPASVKINNK